MSRVRRNPESSDSVRARLAIIASDRQAEFQTVLAQFAAERFLYRLSISSHADRFVLKGATLLTLWRIDRPSPKLLVYSRVDVRFRWATACREYRSDVPAPGHAPAG